MGIWNGLEHIVRQNEPLAGYTWLRLGGCADYFAEPTSRDELVELVTRCRHEDLPVRVIGSGSNVLVRDAGVRGLVLLLSAPAFCQIAVHADGISAGGGAKLTHLISTAVREGFAGLEELAGIPGTVGGALRGNSGTAAADIGQWTSEATVLTRAGELVVHPRSALRFAYRQSSLDELAILDGRFVLDRSRPEELTKRMQKNWIVRHTLQPGVPESAALGFKDVGGVSAASLIEQTSLAGSSVGGARLWEKHPAFIVVTPDATSADVLGLVELVKTGVVERSGAVLETHLDVW